MEMNWQYGQGSAGPQAFSQNPMYQCKMHLPAWLDMWFTLTALASRRDFCEVLTRGLSPMLWRMEVL